MIDTHTHLNFRAFESNWREVVDQAIEAGVEKMVVVGTDMESSRKAVEMTEEHDSLFAAVGVHPHHSRQIPFNELDVVLGEMIDELAKLSKSRNVVAIGEVGIDYHKYEKSKYSDDLMAITDEVRMVQKRLFVAQAELAVSINKPLILHSREAKDDVLEILNQLNGSLDATPTESPLSMRGVRGVFHCFEGSKKYLKQILEAGFFVSFCGNITYVPDRAEVSKEVPLEKLLIETDSPFMTPEPYRSLVNTPANVKIVAQKHADVRGIQFNEVIESTTKNAYELFGIG